MLAEADAIRTAADRLGPQFITAVSMITSCTGKTVVTGLGKSGHIGHKISATLSSLGTPSLFINSSEALHGDSGALSFGDVLIAISNSGATPEVLRTAEIAREIGIPVIAMTGNNTSPLAALAAAILDVHVDSEADHLNLAPTTSSTLTLALGDAIAVAASIARGFSVSDFARFHPGGALGDKTDCILNT